MQPNKERDNPIPVMDVQRPATRPVAPSPTPTLGARPTVFTPSRQQTRPATMEYTRPRSGSTEAPFSQTPQTGVETPSLKPKKSKKGLVIGVFALLFVALAGFGGYYFFVINKKPVKDAIQSTPAPEVKPAEVTDSAKIQATPEGVDKAVQEIDKQLDSQNDAQDFSADDVSDNGLGL